MLGEDYFNARKRLTDVVLHILKLAEKTGADKSPLLGDDITKGLSQPFSLIVFGEVNAGKSTMLNGLFGEELCKTNAVPETDSVQWYRYAEQDHDKVVTPSLQERYRSFDFLLDFNLVDTPGTNALNKEHKVVASKLLSVSDLIFWVFSTDNPWCASTWDLISKQNKEAIDQSVFIIQQADTRDKKDLEIMLGHMRDLSEKRIGRVLPVFPVSGKLAMQAKEGGCNDESILNQSGYLELEGYISETVTQSASRMKMLAGVHEAAAKVIDNIEQMIELQTDLLEENEGFLREIEQEVDKEREIQSADFAVKFSGMRMVFADQIDRIVMIMRRRMNLWRSMKSLFTMENLPKKIETTLLESVQLAVEQQASDDGKNLINACRCHWETIRPRVKQRLAINMKGFEEETGGFGDICERFVTRMGLAARQGVVSLKIHGGLDKQLAMRRAILKTWLYVFLVFLIAAGLAGSFKLGPYPLIPFGLLVGAACSMVIFAYRSRSTRAEIIAVFNEKLNDTQIPFADSLGGDYREGVRDFYIEYGNLLVVVRNHIANARMSLQPNLEQWNALFFELKEIEQEL